MIRAGNGLRLPNLYLIDKYFSINLLFLFLCFSEVMFMPHLSSIVFTPPSVPLVGDRNLRNERDVAGGAPTLPEFRYRQRSLLRHYLTIRSHYSEPSQILLCLIILHSAHWETSIVFLDGIHDELIALLYRPISLIDGNL